MIQLTTVQRSAMFKVDKQGPGTVIPSATATALINRGMFHGIQRLHNGIKCELSDQGKKWLDDHHGNH